MFCLAIRTSFASPDGIQFVVGARAVPSGARETEHWSGGGTGLFMVATVGIFRVVPWPVENRRHLNLKEERLRKISELHAIE